MENVDADIEQSRFIFDRSHSRLYDNVYPRSNEDLRGLYSYVDLYGKSVLSVLGSSDQVFYAYMNGALSVDAFDKNKLSLYYYYLRLWFMKYFNQFSPDLSRNNIKSLLEKDTPANGMENVAYYYWNAIIKEFEDYMIDAFFIESPNNDIVTNWELKMIKDKVLDKELDFYNIDISKDNDIKKQYDVLIVSNIHDWIVHSGDSLVNYIDNLYKLLKDDGEVLISSFILSGAVFFRDSLFREKFEYMKIARTSACSNFYGYVYTKRK